MGNRLFICTYPAHLSKPYLSKVDAEFENDLFWRENADLIRRGWSEWQQYYINSVGYVDVLDPALSRALDDASFQPSEEAESEVLSKVLSHWTSKSTTLPKGVYSAQVLSQDGVAHNRHLLDSATSAGIPRKHPR